MTKTLTATNDSLSYAGNLHRVVIKFEDDTQFIGWPDPTDERNSPHWKPGSDNPIQYPKFAWREVVP